MGEVITLFALYLTYIQVYKLAILPFQLVIEKCDGKLNVVIHILGIRYDEKETALFLFGSYDRKIYYLFFKKVSR